MSKVFITGGLRLSLPWAVYWESHSMNHLSWPTDCKENIQWVGQGKGSLAAESSAALNKQTKK